MPASDWNDVHDLLAELFTPLEAHEWLNSFLGGRRAVDCPPDECYAILRDFLNGTGVKMSESKTETIEFYEGSEQRGYGDNLIVRTVRFPVPGGWIYQTATASRGGGGVHQIFVPESKQ